MPMAYQKWGAQEVEKIWLLVECPHCLAIDETLDVDEWVCPECGVGP